MSLIGNFWDHPTNFNYTVFTFKAKEQADYFEELLLENQIWFEKHVEDTQSYFGVRNSDKKKATNLNYLTFAKFRTFMIPHKGLRYLMVAFGLGILMLALIGYLLS